MWTDRINGTKRSGGPVGGRVRDEPKGREKEGGPPDPGQETRPLPSSFRNHWTGCTGGILCHILIKHLGFYASTCSKLLFEGFSTAMGGFILDPDPHSSRTPSPSTPYTVLSTPDLRFYSLSFLFHPGSLPDGELLSFALDLPNPVPETPLVY